MPNMPVGTKVRMVNCAEAEKYKDRIWTTRSAPWMCCGTLVVLLEGKTGGFAVDMLEIME